MELVGKFFTDSLSSHGVDILIFVHLLLECSTQELRRIMKFNYFEITDSNSSLKRGTRCNGSNALIKTLRGILKVWFYKVRIFIFLSPFIDFHIHLVEPFWEEKSIFMFFFELSKIYGCFKMPRNRYAVLFCLFRLAFAEGRFTDDRKSEWIARMTIFAHGRAFSSCDIYSSSRIGILLHRKRRTRFSYSIL